MSGRSDDDVLLHDSESALSRDSLDVGSDSVFSLHSSQTLSPDSPMNQPTPSAASNVQVACPTSAAGQTSTSAKSKAKISWWWWWDIGGALLSIICVGLVLVVLFRANNRALADWNLWIQPNSLIAVFTTVGKSAMMVPIASCISQLKWRHFELRANRLSDLQLLDEASRGPWGSLMLLSDVRTRAFTVRALAIVSLMSLGFDPSAQQILEFPTREIRLTNTSAPLGVANSYASKAFIEDTDGSTGQFDSPIEWNQDLFKLQSSVINGISGSVSQPAYSCPGERCIWPDFTTLGMCSHFLNLTEKVEVNCVGTYRNQQNCSYRFPIDVPINSGYEAPYVLNVSYAEQGDAWSEPTTIFASRGSVGVSPNGIKAEGAVLFTIKMINKTRESYVDPPKTEAYYSAWHWCEKSYHNVTARPSRISDPDFTFERLSYTGSGSSDGARYVQLIANSTGHAFNISINADNNLFQYLSDLLTRDVVDKYPHAGSANFDADSLDLSTFLHTADIKNFTENLAKELTNQIRSVAPGDNNHVASLAGDVYIKEVYIRVTWPWLIIPLSETLITTGLLVYCIVLSNHRRLFKSSLIALLVHGLDGWSTDEIKIPDSEDSDKLEAMAKDMKARFMEDGDGRLHFCKA